MPLLYEYDCEKKLQNKKPSCDINQRNNCNNYFIDACELFLYKSRECHAQTGAFSQNMVSREGEIKASSHGTKPVAPFLVHIMRAKLIKGISCP